MAKFKRCTPEVEKMARGLLEQYETHALALSAGVTFDFVFAYAESDDDGNPKGDALSKNGIKALGIARKIPLKDRALGRADAEIAIDGDWWFTASEAQQKALLDHELHHICPKVDKRGLVTDDLGRPVLQMRKHDYEFGWFRCIADRHGANSLEQVQARRMLEVDGQFFWPDLCAPKIAEKSAPASRKLSDPKPRATA